MVGMQSSRPDQRRIDLGGFAVDRTNDMQAKEVGQQTIRDIKDRSHLLSVVLAANHKRSLGILQHTNEVARAVDFTLFAPESD